MLKKIFILWFICLTPLFALPKDFVYLQAVNPTILQDMRYYTANNFVGRPIKGYLRPVCILTKNAAMQLAKAEMLLQSYHLNLKVFDCYRPQQAVQDFWAWSKDWQDQKTKARYYPRVDKKDFFKLNYVALQSGHSRGSTVDLTLIDTTSKQELDMGTPFDFMDEQSHPFAKVSAKAHANRMLLRNIMQQAGFAPLPTEWWHFTLKEEIYPQTYFNFVVE